MHGQNHMKFESITLRNGKSVKGCSICQILQEARNSVWCTTKSRLEESHAESAKADTEPT